MLLGSKVVPRIDQILERTMRLRLPARADDDRGGTGWSGLAR